MSTRFITCREVVIFGAEYFKEGHSHDLETLISELVLKRAFRKYILLSPFFLWCLTYSLLKWNVLQNSEISKFSL